jgi:hypothetical protein
MRVGEPRLAEDDVGSRPRERRRQGLELLDDLVLRRTTVGQSNSTAPVVVPKRAASFASR